MTRVAHLQPHFSEIELKHRYRRATDLVESRPWQLVWRCQILATPMTEQIKKLTNYHWLPKVDILTMDN